MASTYVNGSGTVAAVPGPASDQQCATDVQRHYQNSTRIAFRRATKHDAKLRLAVAGPSGSGKTFTLLRIATELGGPIAVADTERGSAEKYADLFEFDTLPLSSFDPELVPAVVDAAVESGYRVLIVDSLSHFWNGTDGELDQVDKAAKRMQNPNSFAAWRFVTPKHNALVDAILQAPIHILVSMRTKTEWVLDRDEKTGKTSPRKIGLAPVMRDGIEYEFDVFGDMDQDHNLIVSKSRCPALADQVFPKPGREVAAALKNWLSAPCISPAQKLVAEHRIEELGGPGIVDPSVKPWRNRGEMRQMFMSMRELVGESEYFRILAEAGVSYPKFEFATTSAAVAWYSVLRAAANRKEVA